MAYGSNARGYWRENNHRRAIAENDLISTHPGSHDRVFVLTKVLHILVGHQSDWALRCLSTLRTGTVSLKDHNAVRRSGCDEGGSVAELSPAAVVLEEDVAQAIAERGQEERHMSDEPCELQRLSELQEALLERFALRGGRWWCHVWAVSRAQWRADWRSRVACDSCKEMPTAAKVLESGRQVGARIGVECEGIGGLQASCSKSLAGLQ